jgi:hypothetical protein
MIRMAWSPWLFGIVADDRPFLMAVDRLHGRIDVEYPRLGEKRRRAIIEMPSHPRRRRGGAFAHGAIYYRVRGARVGFGKSFLPKKLSHAMAAKREDSAPP